MPDALVDRVERIAGDRFTIDLLDVVAVAKITTDDTDSEIARKVGEFASKYPGSVTTPDDWLTELEQDSREANARGLGKLGIR